MLGGGSSSFHWVALFCSLKSVSTDGWGQKTVSFPLVPSRKLVPGTLQEALKEEQITISLMSLASTRSPPSPSPASELSACQVAQHSSVLF